MIAGEASSPDGLPGPLPEGERLLWQGRPDWRLVARHVLHVRLVSLYFAVLLVWYALHCAYAGETAVAALLSTLRLTGLAALVLAMAAGYAWLVARNTCYTITTRRLVMRAGVALPLSINIPFGQVQAADARLNADGSGEIALAVNNTGRLGYAVLWPHARPWRISRPQPMLRGLRDASKVAQVLARALAVSAAAPVAAMPQPRQGKAMQPGGQSAPAAA